MKYGSLAIRLHAAGAEGELSTFQLSTRPSFVSAVVYAITACSSGKFVFSRLSA